MQKIFLQVGYPKCFSTTLQRSFFEKHPEIIFGGVGIGNNIGYVNKELEFVFEDLLKYANQSFFNKHIDEAKQLVDDFTRNTENKVAVFSSEHLIFPFSVQHIDPLEVTNRIRQIFAEYEVHVLLLFRNQEDLLKSLYGEYLKMGYPETYSQFIQWVWGYRDRNFWEALNYNQTYRHLCQQFGQDNTHVQFFEDWKENPEKEINTNLSNILGITNCELPIKNDNPSLTAPQMANLLHLNRKSPRGMGKHVLHPFENHRNRVLLERMDAGYTNDEIFQNVHAKRMAFAEMNQTPQQPFDQFFELSSVAVECYKHMQAEWIHSNQQLEKDLKNLPEGYIA